jgi:hypothetical protein
MAESSSSSKSKWDEQIQNLKEQKEKKEQGLDYSINGSITTNREKRQQQKAVVRPVETKAEEKKTVNPYVRKISLEELIDISREMKGEPKHIPEKKTPFISKEKEIGTPQLSKGR